MSRISYYARSAVELVTGFEGWPRVVGIFLKPERKNSGPVQVSLKQPALAFLVRGRMDVWSVKETYIDRFYIRPEFEPQDGWTVVDIGAGIGEFTIQAGFGMPNSRIIAYEPFPGSFDLLQKNLALNNIHNVQALCKAIWSQAGGLDLDLSGGEPLMFTSRIPGVSDHQKEGVVRTECITLADVLTINKVERVDLLKLDCEGAEYDILLPAAPETLARVERIVMEYHDDLTPHRHEELVKYLSEQGYQVETVSNKVHASLGYLFARRVQA